jgi:hypothetical protein
VGLLTCTSDAVAGCQQLLLTASTIAPRRFMGQPQLDAANRSYFEWQAALYQDRKYAWTPADCGATMAYVCKMSPDAIPCGAPLAPGAPPPNPPPPPLPPAEPTCEQSTSLNAARSFCCIEGAGAVSVFLQLLRASP